MALTNAPPRLRPGALWIGRALALVIFVVSLVAGAVLHLDLAVTRRAAQSFASSFLSSSFRGRIEMENLERLDASGLTARGLQVFDPEDRLVLSVERVDVEVDLFGVVQRLASLYDKLSIVVDRVTLERIDVLLESTTLRNEQGELLSHPSIVDAFSPSTPAESETNRSGRPIRVWFADVRMREVFASARMTDLPIVQARAPEAQGTILITEKGLALDVEQFSLVASGLGGVDTRAKGNLHLRAPGAMWGSLQGTVGSLPWNEEFRFEASRLTLNGSLPELEPSGVRALWADWPLDRTISLEHEVSGVPPRLQVLAKVRTERGDATARGVITVSPEFEADLDLDIESLDLTALRSDLPQTELSVRSAIEIWQGVERPHFELNATLLPGTVQGTAIPAVDFRGTYDERGVIINATMHERGLPLHFDVTQPVDGPLTFDLELRRTRLEESPRLAQWVGIRGTMEGRARGQLKDERVHASMQFKGNALGWGQLELQNFSLTGDTSAPLDDLETAALDWQVQAQGLRVQQFELESIQSTIRGPWSRPAIALQARGRDGSTLNLKGTTRTDRVELDRVQAELSGHGQPILTRFSHLSFIDGRLRLDDFHLQSEGSLSADLDLSRSGGQIRVDSTRLNLSRIAEILGFGPHFAAGRLSTHIDAQLGVSSRGELELGITDGQIAGVSGLDLELKTKLEDKTSQGTATIRVNELGRIQGNWTALLAGHPFEAKSYTHATGEASIELLDLSLPLVSDLALRGQDLSILAGVLVGKLSLSRRSKDDLPELELSARTQNLSFDIGKGASARHSDSVNFNLVSTLEPNEDRWQWAARATDYRGDVLSVSGSIQLPLSEWGEALPSIQTASATLGDAPLELIISIPQRRIDELPSWIERPPLFGQITGLGTIRGSLRDPSLQLSLSAQNVTGKATGLTSPMNWEASIRYRKSNGHLLGDVRAQQDKTSIGSARFDLTLPFEHFFAPLQPGTPFWTGQAQLVLDSAPLELLEPIAKKNLRGFLQGSVTVRRASFWPELESDLRVRHLSVAGRKLGEGRLTVESQDQRLLAKAQFDDEYGTLTTSGELQLVANEMFAWFAPNKPIYLTLRSEKYDAAVLSPFLKDYLTEFSGSLHGTLRVELRPGETNEDDWGTRFSGQLRMSEAVITPAVMGLRLDDTSFDIQATPEGALNVVRLSNLKARARSDTHNLSGSATLYFDNLELLRGQFQLDQSNVPLLTDGVKLADLTGHASGNIESNGTEKNVTLELPRLNVELPMSSDRDLIELTDNPTIEILQPLAAPSAQKELEENPTTWNVQVELGDAVRVKNRMINLGLTGSPHLKYTNELSMTGRVELVPGGRIQVMGRVFVIDHGAILFDTESVTNPHIDVSATWRAPNGVLVRATVGGTADRPLLEWSSDPPLPGGEAEVIAMVLGGSGRAQSGDAGGAGLAYGAAIVNELLGQSGVKGVEIYATRQSDAGKGQVARLSDRSWDNYTAAFQVSESLWFEGSYKQETAGPETTPRSGVSGTLDWRFHPAWSARTEIGTLGIGLDLLWQYRY